MDKWDDLKEKVSIVEYAKHIGYHPEKVGSFYTLKEHDSVRINPRRNIFYQNSKGVGGSVIDFVMVFTGKTLSEAIKDLWNYAESSLSASNITYVKNYTQDTHKKEEMKEPLILPSRDKTYRNVFAYLHKTRCIDKEIINYMISRKMLYQDTHKNCVFVSYENKTPVFACLRSTNTYVRFIGDVKGSDYIKCFFIPSVRKEVSTELVITEGVIDSLSLMSLGKKNSDYLALSGAWKYKEVISHYIKPDKYKNIIIALDNDNAGITAGKQLKEKLLKLGLHEENIKIMLPKEKNWDWNDVLVKSKEAK
ncbi:MAG: toprim domain-containing protein [Hornefia sp.]|nr:toprim domain-containing protein [Hornefia sp.]